MANVILILGGARSGKSTFATQIAKKQCKKVAYIATMPVCDDEMKKRVRQHRRSRPGTWPTIEAPYSLLKGLSEVPKKCDGVLIECIGTYVSNLLISKYSDPDILKEIKAVLAKLRKSDKKVFIVSNEVGGGVVPDTELGRKFRDIVGKVNQIIAKSSDEVYLVVAGLSMKLK